MYDHERLHIDERAARQRDERAARQRDLHGATSTNNQLEWDAKRDQLAELVERVTDPVAQFILAELIERMPR